MSETSPRSKKIDTKDIFLTLRTFQVYSTTIGCIRYFSNTHALEISVKILSNSLVSDPFAMANS
jgi:hypothetical protein